MLSREQIVSEVNQIIRELLCLLSDRQPSPPLAEDVDALHSLKDRVRGVQVALFKELEADFATDDEDAKLRRRSWKVGVFDAMNIIAGELSRKEARIRELLKHLDDDED